MSNILHESIWIFLKIISTIYDILNWCFRKLKTFCLKSYDLAHNRSSSYDIEYLESCKHSLDKVPKHLSIIVGHDDDTSPETLSKIAVYALVMDIDYISFYDTRGQFTLDKVQVPKFVSSKKMQNGHFLWSMPADKRNSAQLTYRNGMEKTIEVVFFDSRDGKPMIADICRELYASRNTAEVKEAMKDRPRLTKKISEALHKRLNHIPDPECAIIFNSFMCTFGLLPWNTGFTEFYLIETGSYFNVGAFARVLYKFSKCEQRFGR